MATSDSPRYYHPELFENLKGVAEEKKWLETEVIWEAWIADTILVVSDFLKNAVLSGGSAVRNLTQVYRLTYHVDFDTREEDINAIFESLKQANAMLGGRRNLEDSSAGLITTQQGANVVESFRGPNRLAKFHRWTQDGARPLKLHIMNVSDLPEMFPGEMRKLETLVKIDALVPNASRKCLFYRKSIRANKEARAEDFLDLSFILETSKREQISELIQFCSSDSKKKAVTSGLRNLVNKRKDFKTQIDSRLAHARPAGSIDEWIEQRSKRLEKFIGLIAN